MLSKHTFFYPADVPNVNERVYPKDVVRKAFEEYKPAIVERSAIGMFLQQEDVHRDFGCTYLDLASHLVTDVQEVGLGFNVTVEVLNTPKGRILNNLIEVNKERVRVGISGIGEVEDNIVKSLKVLTIDFIEGS